METSPAFFNPNRSDRPGHEALARPASEIEEGSPAQRLADVAEGRPVPEKRLVSDWGELKRHGIVLTDCKYASTVRLAPHARFTFTEFRGGCSVGFLTYSRAGCYFRKVEIGNYCSIAPDVVIGPTQHPTDRLSTSGFAYGDPAGFKKDVEVMKMLDFPVAEDRALVNNRTVIGNDVWIGQRALIMQGVTIGHGAIVGANAVVTRDVPPYAVVVGMPARVIRFRFDDAVIERLLHSDWGSYMLDRRVLGDLDFSEIDRALDAIGAAIADGKLERVQHRFELDGTKKNLYELPKQVSSAVVSGKV